MSSTTSRPHVRTRSGRAPATAGVPAPRQPTSTTRTSPPVAPEEATVAFRRVATRGESAFLALLLVVATLLTLRYALWWFDDTHLPTNAVSGPALLVVLANVGPFLALTALETVRVLQMAVQWVFASCMRSPVPMAVPTGLRIAVLTTVVPSKEPLDILEKALTAMRAIRHPEPFDVWVLDEEDDPRVRLICDRLGVHHFSRHGVERWNQPSGAFRARTKAGNHNAWRDRHAADYDVVAQMDPDHIADPGFLEHTLGYFRDPDVAYVIAPQVYYRNTDDSWVARGADEQNFGFSAITQRGANLLGMPIFIGSNHLCRTSALDSVGGYASHIVEDHLTGMQMLTTDNPATGRRWKGVFTEEIISLGEGPARWSSYLSQQLRWAYGLLDIVRGSSVRLLRRMRPRQALGFVLVQSYYPSVAFVLVTGLALTTLHLTLGVNAFEGSFGEWVGYWLPQFAISMTLWFWLQRFYLREGDRGWGLRGFFVGLGAMVTYTQAVVMVAFRRPLSYVVTPKGEVGTREPLRLFRWHLLSLTLSAVSLAWAVVHSAGAPTILFWAVLNIVQMGLVIGTGAVFSDVLRWPVSWGRWALVSRYPWRVGVPLAVVTLSTVLAPTLATL